MNRNSFFAKRTLCGNVPESAFPFFMHCLPLLSFACAPIGRRFGHPCKHSTVSFRPPSRNPGRHHAWYCIALSPETLHATSLQCPRLCLASGSLTRQSGCGSAFRASTPPCHSRLRAGILGGLMRSIALHCRLAIVHPRQRLPRLRVGARGDGANAPFVPSCPSALPPRTPTVSFRAPNRNPGLPCAGYCATTTPLPSPASAPQGAGSEAGMTDGKETRKG